MSDITGFNSSKAHVLLLIVALCFSSTFTVFLFHTLFPAHHGTILNLATIFGVSLIGYISLYLIVDNKVKKNEKVVTEILNSINDVILIKDFQGNFVFCNSKVAELYNSTPREMVGKDDFHFTKNKEQADFFRENVQSIMRRFEKEEVYETSTDANTGEIRYFQSIKIPFRDMKQKLKIAVIAKDITDIMRLKEEADRNKKRLQHVLDVSEEGLWEWNVQTNEVLHNKQWEMITGIERSERSFKEFEGCILSEDKKLVSDALEGLIKHNRSYNIEFRMRRPDGEVIWIWDRGRIAEYDENNNPLWLVGLALDITIEKHNQNKINNLAYHDQLTGLVNRAQLEIELEQTIEISERENLYSAVLFLDLDRFKLLNDSYGHHMGDQLLKAVAEQLRAVDDSKTTISRFGGDEFVIILHSLDQDQSRAFKAAKQFGDKVVHQISQIASLKSDVQNISIEYSITGSVGGIVFKSGKVSTGELIQLADLALYRTKANGGHSAMIFDMDMQSELRHTSELQKSMYDSIANRDFCIHLQPKYTHDEQIIGAEALVRWHHPQLGLLYPDAFLGMAEESNLIIPIGKIVLERACQQLVKWQSNPGTEHLKIAVNLSAKEIWQTNFVSEFIKVVECYNIDHSKLIIEVTESVLIKDITDATDKLIKLKNFGISISLDDFGTGYSSLNYLRSLPIDEIKIDRSFIQDVAQDKQAHLVVRSIIDMAKNFELEVVAEGVELKEQFELLKNYNVDIFQGYYFSKPVSSDEIDELMNFDLQPASVVSRFNSSFND